MKHFCSIHSRNSDGRYVIHFPFKKGPPIDIDSSRFRTEKMLKMLECRFHDNSAVTKKYEVNS